MAVAISNLSAIFVSTSNTYNAIGMNVITTAYNANSKFLNMKLNGKERFTVSIDGEIKANTIPVGRIHISNTAPVAPFVGDEWTNPETGVTYKYINDGDSSAWVQFGVFGISAPEFGFNLDGGFPDSTYGGIYTIDAGALT